MLCYALDIVATRELAAQVSTAPTIVYSGLEGPSLMTPLLAWI